MYFKQNLYRDAKGIYIHQTFRQFAEKGYITVEGPLLTVFRIDANRTIFDNLDEVATAELSCIWNTDDEAAYFFYERLRCYASVGAGVAPYFSEFLEETGDGFSFYAKPVEVRKITQWY